MEEQATARVPGPTDRRAAAGAVLLALTGALVVGLGGTARAAVPTATAAPSVALISPVKVTGRTAGLVLRIVCPAGTSAGVHSSFRARDLPRNDPHSFQYDTEDGEETVIACTGWAQRVTLSYLRTAGSQVAAGTAVLVELGTSGSLAPLGDLEETAQAVAVRQPPLPAPLDDDRVYYEASSRTYEEQWDDHGSEVRVNGTFLVLQVYDGDDSADIYFATRPGSTFAISTCDAAGNVSLVPVSRRVFFQRVEATTDKRVVFSYDAQRRTGDYVAYAGYPVDGDLASCPPA